MRDIAQNTLFDISACKCINIKQRTCKLKNNTLCAERHFLNKSFNKGKKNMHGKSWVVLSLTYVQFYLH